MQTEYRWQCPICNHVGVRGTSASAKVALWRHKQHDHAGQSFVQPATVWGHCADCVSNIGRKLCQKGNEVNSDLRPCWSEL